MLKFTKQHLRFWKNRKIDWNLAYGSNPEAYLHPHRRLIVEQLQKWKFGSICEIGCAGGANLILIRKCFPNVGVGGVDINADAIMTAKSLLPGAILDIRPATNLYFSDKCTDISLMDMVGIYHGPKAIRQALREMKRITRRRVMFVEFHSKSWFNRMALWFATGYNAYNWRELLLSEGFDDVQIKKIPPTAWPGGEPQKSFGYIISAKI